jgi:hypothetical protein
VIGKTVLHFERERPANCVEAVDRIARNECESIDGVLWNQIPIDDVTEDLVDAHPVLIDGNSLRRADDRRGAEAAVVEIELELVPGLVT